MGKNLIQQVRGKGTPTYRAPSFRYRGEAKLRSLTPEIVEGRVVDFVHCPGHTAPLAAIQYVDGEHALMVAPEGLKVGDTVQSGSGAEPRQGNVLPLRDIPEGTPVFNLENNPGDRGKFCKSSGVFARVVSRSEDGVVIMLPSKKQRTFHPECRATIGVIAGKGRKEKPFLKAGKKMHAMRARNKLYPRTSGCAMNAVDHPFGNKRSSRKAKQKPVNRFAPPGAKVGKLWPKRTGKK